MLLLADTLSDLPPRAGPHVRDADAAPEPSVAQGPSAKLSVTDHQSAAWRGAAPRNPIDRPDGQGDDGQRVAIPSPLRRNDVLFVFLITVCLLAAGALLLAAREKVVRAAGVLLLTAVFLTVFWLWEARRTVMQALSLDNSELLLFHCLFVGVCVAASWVWFLGGLLLAAARQKREEAAVLSSVGQPRDLPNDPQQLARPQQPPPGEEA